MSESASLEKLTYQMFYKRAFSDNTVWTEFCSLVALSQLYKINVYIITDSASQKYSFKIGSEGSSRCIVFGLFCATYWVSLLPNAVFEKIDVALKSRKKHKK